MILTEKEKANRYDALQTAIKYTLEKCKKYRESEDSQYFAYRGSIPGAYHKGQSVAYEQIISDLERWSDGL